MKRVDDRGGRFSPSPPAATSPATHGKDPAAGGGLRGVEPAERPPPAPGRALFAGTYRAAWGDTVFHGERRRGERHIPRRLARVRPPKDEARLDCTWKEGQARAVRAPPHEERGRRHRGHLGATGERREGRRKMVVHAEENRPPRRPSAPPSHAGGEGRACAGCLGDVLEEALPQAVIADLRRLLEAAGAARAGRWPRGAPA